MGVTCRHPHTAQLQLQQARLSQQVTPTNSANPPMAEQRTEETRIKGGLSEPQSQSEGVFCQTQIKKKQQSNTSAKKQRQTAPPRYKVERGTPLLSRADISSSFRPSSAPAVIRDDSPWNSGQVQPRIQLRITLRQLPVLNTPPRDCAEVIPQPRTRAEARPTYYNQRTTQNRLYDFDINKRLYMWYCGFHCHNPIVSYNVFF